jgi:hypothetical protein
LVGQQSAVSETDGVQTPFAAKKSRSLGRGCGSFFLRAVQIELRRLIA